jgi:hypothetical protein
LLNAPNASIVGTKNSAGKGGGVNIGSMSYYLTLKALDPDGSKGIFAPNNPKFGKNKKLVDQATAAP